VHKIELMMSERAASMIDGHYEDWREDKQN
jgi:hypothetical protein